jgi:hypothetical protein
VQVEPSLQVLPGVHSESHVPLLEQWKPAGQVFGAPGVESHVWPQLGGGCAWSHSDPFCLGPHPTASAVENTHAANKLVRVMRAGNSKARADAQRASRTRIQPVT